AQPHPPLWYELIDRLSVKARLPARIRNAVELPVDTIGEKLALQFEIGLDRVAVGGPFVNGIPDQRIGVAIEDVIRAVENRGDAVARLGVQPGQARAVAAAVIDVAARMGEQAVTAKADMGRAGRGEGVAPKDLATKLDKLPGRRQPAKLDAIIVILV